jgi:hypothetical protein
MSVEQIIEECLKSGIEVLSITDHDSLSGYRTAKKIIEKNKLPIILVPGCEISSKDGHILAYGIQTEIPPKLSAKTTIDMIHEQKGIAIAAHPFTSVYSLKNKIKKLADILDGVECFCSFQTMLAIRKGMKLTAKLGLPAIAGSDAHMVSRIGSGKIIFRHRAKSWHDVLKMIISKDFGVEITRPKYTKMAKEFVKENIKIRKELKNLR